jgi:N-acetyl-gamma-glutamyl-phosphate reductase
MVHTVFIDGEAGTTGLQIRERLSSRSDLRLVSIDPERRKDLSARREMLNSVDAVILCLPDDAAKEAVGLIESKSVKVIDASTVHRAAEGWAYGFPEMSKGQRKLIKEAKRVSNPGCYPTGAIALIRPLVAAGVLPNDWPMSINAVSGYSGGGRQMIEEFEDESSSKFTHAVYRPYGLNLNHKHNPEMQIHGGLLTRPIFTPAVARFRQGMIVEVPLHLDQLPGAPELTDLQDLYAKAYRGEKFVEVASNAEAKSLTTLDPQALNGTNLMKLYVFGNPETAKARLVAVLDNLGKGASGAAVQNLNLMLGLEEGAGL